MSSYNQTYRDLLEKLQNLTEEQLDMTVTVEDNYENKCYPAQFDICGENHDSLDNDHPVIRF